MEDMTEEERIEFNKKIEEEGKIIAKELEEMAKKDTETFKLARNELSNEMKEHLDYEIQESGHCSNYEIVENPRGENQNCNGYEFWVNQTTNGGYAGDEFAGTCYFKIKENKYLAWDYWM